MGKFSKERIQKHLQNLSQQIDVLRSFQKEPIEAFKDRKNIYAVYHAFLLAIQNTMDIGGHILASIFKQPFSEYEEITPALAEKKVISKELGRAMKGMAGFRNKLVHNYIEIKPKRVYQYLQEEVDLFIKFSKEIIDFIEKQK